jgi:hypothetical protein
LSFPFSLKSEEFFGNKMLTKSELNVEKRWMSKQVDKKAEFRQFRAYLGWPSLREIAATLYLPSLLRHWTKDIESLQNR